MSPERRILPDRRENTHAELMEAFENHIGRTEARLHRFFKRALIAIAVIGIACAVSLFGFGIVLDEQQQTSDQLEQLVKQNKQFALDIQQQRREAILESCTAQNARHDGSVKALVDGSNLDQKNAPNAAARKEIRRRRDVTIALLDALAPVQNCQKLIKESVKGG